MLYKSILLFAVVLLINNVSYSQIGSSCAAGESEIIIELIPDNYPNETSWSLYADNIEILTGAANGDTICVDSDACIQFEINENKISDKNRIDYKMPIASAQVKSAVLLASLGSQNMCTIKELKHSRDHTEIMLESMGADIEVNGDNIDIKPLSSALQSFTMDIPADPSSAAFFIALKLRYASANSGL